METTVQKWGNSLAVRIPKSFAAEAQITQQSRVELSVEDGKLVITPIAAPAYALEELVAGITEENRHAETDWGRPAGSEVW